MQAYARYSSDNQREESIDGQLCECKVYAEKNDFHIVGTYIDRALSAKTDNRPEFQNMIKDSAKKKFDIIIVWKLDRFARNRYDSARYKNTLKKNGVKVVSATEAISEGAEGILLESDCTGRCFTCPTLTVSNSPTTVAHRRQIRIKWSQKSNETQSSFQRSHGHTAG